MKCFKVQVKTTNCLHKTFDVNMPKDIFESEKIKADYQDCENGIIYVVAKDISFVAEKYKRCVEKIEEIGIGYIVSEESKDDSN